MMEGATQLEPSWNTSNPQKVIFKGGWVGITGTKLSVLEKMKSLRNMKQVEIGRWMIFTVCHFGLKSMRKFLTHPPRP